MDQCQLTNCGEENDKKINETVKGKHCQENIYKVNIINDDSTVELSNSSLCRLKRSTNVVEHCSPRECFDKKLFENRYIFQLFMTNIEKTLFPSRLDSLSLCNQNEVGRFCELCLGDVNDHHHKHKDELNKHKRKAKMKGNGHYFSYRHCLSLDEKCQQGFVPAVPRPVERIEDAFSQSLCVSISRDVTVPPVLLSIGCQNCFDPTLKDYSSNKLFSSFQGLLYSPRKITLSPINQRWSSAEEMQIVTYLNVVDLEKNLQKSETRTDENCKLSRYNHKRLLNNSSNTKQFCCTDSIRLSDINIRFVKRYMVQLILSFITCIKALLSSDKLDTISSVKIPPFRNRKPVNSIFTYSLMFLFYLFCVETCSAIHIHETLADEPSEGFMFSDFSYPSSTTQRNIGVGLILPHSVFASRVYRKNINTALKDFQKGFGSYNFSFQDVKQQMFLLTPSPTGKCLHTFIYY